MSQTNNKAQKNNFFMYIFSAAFVSFIVLILVLQTDESYADENVVTVYKSPTCGCCKKWVSHLEDNGFKVNAIDTDNMTAIKDKNGVPMGARSCHTAIVGGYVIEGHVPADDIKKLLQEKRQVTGLAVPGMPMGSPGMEGNRVDKYSVYEFDKSGKAAVVNQY
ncbi:DUF411 domain-containing protein [sulfur-oxidizing endosymbiont of Gigantopelta aegis]|uniref:DUF411 domain-containing protein n=1 Tax=sulfur-oxidizing endosymbiont of Gigantopelta aegis TaxID=2794934 RepID=UPI001FE292FA|nr:DUF411 domain-containing protein [sulfur-oxidizing endosymbiont of Gigantopelta aegis]